MKRSLTYLIVLISTLAAPLTANPTRLALLRELRAAREAASSAQKTVQKQRVVSALQTQSKPTAVSQPIIEEVALPSLPTKPARLNEHEEMIWGRLIKAQPALHEQGEVSAEQFAAAALEVKELIGPDLFGNDPQDTIAKNGVLQQLLLHVILQIKPREATAFKDDSRARKAVSSLLTELFEQWQRLGIDRGAMAPQRSNALSLYASWTDEALSASQEAELAKIERAAVELSSHTTTISDRTKAAGIIATIVGGGALAGWLVKSGRARAAVRNVTRTITRDIPETTDADSADEQEAHNKAVDDALEAIADVTGKAHLIAGEEQAARKAIAGAHADLEDTEAPGVEARKLSLALFGTLYANNKLDDRFKTEKIVHSTFFATAHIGMPWLARGLERMNELLDKPASGDDGDTVADLILEDKIALLEIVNLPPSFFKEAAQLPAELRYPVAEQATTLLLKLATKNNGAPTLFFHYFTPLFDAFDGLALATNDERRLFKFLRTSFIDLLNCIKKITGDSFLDLSTWPNLTLDGESPTTTYVQRAKVLTSNLKSRQRMIAANYRLRNIFISPVTGSPILNRQPGFNEEDYPALTDATKLLMNQVERLTASLKESGYNVVTDYAWNEVEKTVRSPLSNLRRIVVKGEPAFSSNNQRRITRHLEQLAEFMSEPEHQDKRNALQQSEKLRREFITAASFPDDFWTLGVQKLDADDRHAMAGAGWKLTSSLITPPQAAGDSEQELTALGSRLGFDDEEMGTIRTLAEKFQDFALAGDGERTQYESFKGAMDDVLGLIKTFNAEYKAMTNLEENPTEEQVSAYDEKLIQLNNEYRIQMTRISEVLNSKAERIAFKNHIMRPLLFTEKGGIRIQDIPEGLDKESQKLTEEVLELILDNPQELGYAGVNQEGIQVAIRQLITDTRTDSRETLLAMIPENRDVFYDVSQAITNLHSLTEFARGAKQLYSLIKDDRTRSIISDNAPIRSVLMSSDGILRLPKNTGGARLTMENAFAEGGLSDMDRIFAIKLYEMALEHPNDLKMEEDDPLHAGLKARLVAFKAVAPTSNATMTGARAGTGHTPKKGDRTAGGAVLQAAGAVARESTTQYTLPTTDRNGAPLLKNDGTPLEAADHYKAIQSMLNFLSERRAELTNWETTASGATLVKQALDDDSERETFALYDEVKAFMYSEEGLLIPVNEIPRPLNVEAFDAWEEMIDVLLSHPSDLGYDNLTSNPHDDHDTLYDRSGSVITTDEIQNHLQAMQKSLKKRRDYMEENDYDEEEDGDKYDPRSQGIDPDAAINMSGGLLPAEKVLGPRPDSRRTAQWNDRQRQTIYWLYDEGYAGFRSRQVSNMYAAASQLYSLLFDMNMNETMMGGISIKQRLDLHRIINRPALRAAFHRTIFPAFVPDDLVDPEGKGPNPDWSQEIAEIVKFYKEIREDAKDFALDALHMKKAKLMLEWLKTPEKAPTRNDVLRSKLRGNPDAAKGNPAALAILAGVDDKTAALASLSGSMQAGSPQAGTAPGSPASASGGNMLQTMMMMNMMKGKGGSSSMNPMMLAAMNGGSINPMMLAAMNGGKVDPFMLMAANGGKMDAATMMQMQLMQQSQAEKNELKEQIDELKERNEQAKQDDSDAPESTQFKQAAASDKTWEQVAPIVKQDTRLITREMSQAVAQLGNEELSAKLKQAKQAESMMQLLESNALKDNVIEPEEADRLDTVETRLLQLKKEIEDGLIASLTEPKQQAVRSLQQGGLQHSQRSTASKNWHRAGLKLGQLHHLPAEQRGSYIPSQDTFGHEIAQQQAGGYDDYQTDSHLVDAPTQPDGGYWSDGPQGPEQQYDGAQMGFLQRRRLRNHHEDIYVGNPLPVAADGDW